MTKKQDLGVDPKLSGEIKRIIEPCGEDEWESEYPIFTLTDLLSILPKEIEIDGYTYRINIYFESPSEPVIGNQWCAYYRPIKHNERSPRIDDVAMYAPELIDALYQLLIYVLKNNLNQQK